LERYTSREPVWVFAVADWLLATRGTLIQAWLLWGLLYGSIGLGFFIYGRKQRAPIPLLCGIALMVFPYFVSNIVLLVAIGALLIAIPYFFRE
jgi:hypothetical protein